MRELELMSVVALLEDDRRHNLRRGQVGTVVERLRPGMYEVEFSDDDGRTYAFFAAPRRSIASASSRTRPSTLIISIRAKPSHAFRFLLPPQSLPDRSPP